MRDLIAALKRWKADGKRDIALATIVATHGSSLRPAGTRMAITSEGDIAGSISSGCVDSDVIAAMEALLRSERSFERLHFGAAAPASGLGEQASELGEAASGLGEQASELGLGEVSDRYPRLGRFRYQGQETFSERNGRGETFGEQGEPRLACGGELDVIIERWGPVYDQLMAEVEAERPVGFAMYLGDKGLGHWLYTGQPDRATYGDADIKPFDDDGLARAMTAEVREAWPGAYTTTKVVTTNDAPKEAEVFIEVIPPPPVLLIFGATDIATALNQMAQQLDYHVIVSDARRAFLTEVRFPNAELRRGWPQDQFTPQDIGPNWAIVVLFHDPKLDGPALNLALRSEAMYVGLLGGRKTQADRRAMLCEMGFDAADLARIHGPVGLNIGGKHPAMIALSILSEIVAVGNGAQTSPPGPRRYACAKTLERGRETPPQTRVRPYEPVPIPAEDFHEPGMWSNINDAPYDIDALHLSAAGVIYKRATHIKRVRYTPLIPAPEMPEPWRGEGEAIVRWLFSEYGPPSSLGDTQEGLVRDQALVFVHDTTLMSGASSGMQAHPDIDEILYVIAGAGTLYHRSDDGSPITARPLRPGDAVLIRGWQYHSIANAHDPTEVPLRLMVIGLASDDRRA